MAEVSYLEMLLDKYKERLGELQAEPDYKPGCAEEIRIWGMIEEIKADIEEDRLKQMQTESTKPNYRRDEGDLGSMAYRPENKPRDYDPSDLDMGI